MPIEHDYDLETRRLFSQLNEMESSTKLLVKAIRQHQGEIRANAPLRAQVLQLLQASRVYIKGLADELEVLDTKMALSEIDDAEIIH